MVSALKAEGLTLQEFRNWQTHNRNAVGAFDNVNGVVIHHTVTADDDASVALCYEGHSNLPGPLCHAVGRNDGRIALVGHGRANHAGLGDPDVLNAVINESATLPADNEATVDGNRRFYGIEIVNMGNGTDTYTWVQYRSAVKWATAVCRAHGWSERSVIGHREWQPGKIDPYGPVIGPDGARFDFTMSRFRADVKAALAQPAGAWGTEEEDMALSAEDKTWIKAELKAIVEDIFDYDTVPAVAPPDENADWHEGNTNWSFRYAVHSPNVVGRETRRLVRELQAKVDGLAVGGVDMDALAEKVADKLAQRLAD